MTAPQSGNNDGSNALVTAGTVSGDTGGTRTILVLERVDY